MHTQYDLENVLQNILDTLKNSCPISRKTGTKIVYENLKSSVKHLVKCGYDDHFDLEDNDIIEFQFPLKVSPVCVLDIHGVFLYTDLMKSKLEKYIPMIRRTMWSICWSIKHTQPEKHKNLLKDLMELDYDKKRLQTKNKRQDINILES